MNPNPALVALRFAATLQKFKYPRTFHLPWSLGATDDDKTHTFEDIEAMFGGKQVVVTEKADGENTTIYSGGASHARSLDSRHHESRDIIKSKAAEVGHLIPEGWRLMGENMFAKHSIEYEGLPAYFMMFSIADESNRALSWDDVEEWGLLLGIPTVPVVWRGRWDTKKAMSLYPFKSLLGGKVSEGYVVRDAGSFSMSNFSSHVAKFVRANHVQTDSVHWSQQRVVPNKLD